MASVNQVRPQCVNQIGKTHSKPLAARHGMGRAWARKAMCESAFTVEGIIEYSALVYIFIGITIIYASQYEGLTAR